MKHTIVAVFKDQSHAELALSTLLAEGYSREDVYLNTERVSAGVAQQSAAMHDDDSFATKARSFLAELFGPHIDAAHSDTYTDALRRGNALLTVRVANDIDVTHACELLNRFEPVDLDDQVQQDQASQIDELTETGLNTRMQTPSDLPTEHRSVASRVDTKRGGLRVYSNTAAQSNAEQTVDLNAVTASGEAQAMAARTTHMGDDSDFRTHWQSAYGTSGDRYEDYADAYRYGMTNAGSEQYRGYRWDEVEPHMQRDWESQQTKTPWVKAKNAVRYAWEKVSH